MFLIFCFQLVLAQKINFCFYNCFSSKNKTKTKSIMNNPSTGQVFSCLVLSLFLLTFTVVPEVDGVCCYPTRSWYDCFKRSGGFFTLDKFCDDCIPGTPYCGKKDCNIFGRLFCILFLKIKFINNNFFKTCCDCGCGCR